MIWILWALIIYGMIGLIAGIASLIFMCEKKDDFFEYVIGSINLIWVWLPLLILLIIDWKWDIID